MAGASLLFANWLGLIGIRKKQEPEVSVSDNSIGEAIDDYFQSLRKEDEPAGHYYLDKSDDGTWLIKHSVYDYRFTAGNSKPKAQSVIFRLNQSQWPIVEQPELNILHICFEVNEEGFEIINLN
jgi:hypothetical protein